jgi:hypothetical protein
MLHLHKPQNNQLWIETSETKNQNNLFLFEVTYLRYFVIAMEKWLI